MRTLIYPVVVLLCALLAAAPFARAAADEQVSPEQREKDAIIVQALQRLDSFDIDSRPKIKAALLRHLDTIAGSEAFVDLVGRFGVKERGDALVKLAVAHPDDNLGVDAAKLLIRFDQLAKLRAVIDGEDREAAANAMAALGHTNEKRAVDLLLGIVQDDKRAVPTRSAAVAALGKGQAGQLALLEMVKREKTPELLKVTVTNALHGSPDPQVRAQAQKLLPMPATLNNKPLPPLAELVQREGDPAAGKPLFVKVQCATCHKVNGAGVDFGPDLSEIGSKLSREAMYVSILDPSAGISHNYEGARVRTADGLDLVGIIVSETDDKLVMKTPGGIVQTFTPDQIELRETLPVSIMPAGLTRAMTTEQLVDLVAYLGSLKGSGRDEQTKRQGDKETK